jgi:hypothetical protein
VGHLQSFGLVLLTFHLLSRSGQYATLAELLDKLLFLAVSGDGKLPFLTCWHYRIHSIDHRSNVYFAFPSYISKICESSQYIVGYAEANARTRQFNWRSDVCKLRTDEVS